jgi:hypothetical protein
MVSPGINQQSFIYNKLLNGVVAKWQGKGLQNPHHGFKSHRRLRSKQVQADLFFLFHPDPFQPEARAVYD